MSKFLEWFQFCEIILVNKYVSFLLWNVKMWKSLHLIFTYYFFKVSTRSIALPFEEAQSFEQLRTQVDGLLRELVDNNPMFRTILEVKRNALLQRIRVYNEALNARRRYSATWCQVEVMNWSAHLLSILNEVLRYQVDIFVLLRLGAPNVWFEQDLRKINCSKNQKFFVF